MYVKKNFKLWLAVFALALPLLFVGTASAKYMSDGAASDPTGTAGWLTPNDMVCIVGVHADGTLDIADGVTNARNCIYLQTGNMNGGTAFDLTAMTTKAACTTAGGTGNDGAAHSWATSYCSKSLQGLDRTSQMCTAIGGTWVTTGKCVAYGRQFKGQDANGTPLALSAGPGFCYAKMRTGIALTSCPSVVTSPTLTYGTQNATSSAAFGYTATTTQCTYDFGINGVLDAALTKADGTTYAAGTTVNLSAFTTMGTCIANGGSWSNWIPMGTSATIGSITGVTFDLTRQAAGSTEGCLHCHSSLTEYNGPAEREKDSYLKTGHKNMLRKATAGKKLVGPDGVAYTTDGTNAINFMTSSDPYAKITVAGVDQNLYYVYGDWMIATPTTVYGKTGYGVAPNGTTADNNGYSCYACHTTGAKDISNPGVQSIGTPGYAGTQPGDSFPNLLLNAANPKWDINGITCGRCHNVTVPSVTAAQISASTFTTTAPTSGGMGALASGTGRANLCFGCHQSIGKDWPAGTTTADPTKIPTGVSHGAAPGRDFNGHVLGNSFLNSVHANYTGTITLNSLGKFDLTDPNGTSEYNSLFKGYTCWQTPASNSPAKTKADGTEIKTKSDCETIYGVGSWRADQDGSGAATSIQGTCTTCHDVHNSLFVASQEEAAIRKTCKDCHVNNATTGATDAGVPTIVEANINHPMGSGTPFDTGRFGDDSCAVCHMALQAELNGDQNTMPAHVWRINTNASYNTFPTVTQFYGGSCTVHAGTVVAAATKFVQAIYQSDTTSALCTSNSGTWTSAAKDQNAQTAPDTNSNAVWVDLDMACGQCHGGSGGSTATHNSAPYLNKAVLASYAAQMHGTPLSTGTTPTVSSTGLTQSGYTVSFTDSSIDSGDTSNLDAVTVNWGDGATSAGVRGGAFSHTYTGRARNVSIVHMVRNSVNSNLYSKEILKLVVPVRYNVTGTVFQSDGITAITNAYVYLKQSNHTRQVVKATTGAFSFANVLPGTYTIHVYKSGVTFGADATVTVTAADAAQNINATNP